MQHVGVRRDDVVALLGQADRARPAGADLLDAADHLVVQEVAAAGRHDAEHRQPVLDQRDRPVLELAGREALGVDVGELLELERALERDREAGVPAEEEHRRGVLEARAPARRPRRRRRAPAGRGRASPASSSTTCADLVAVLGAPHLGEVEPEQVAGDQLGQEALGRRDADLGAGVGVDDRVGLARDRRAVGVADREHLRALLARVPDRHAACRRSRRTG